MSCNQKCRQWLNRPRVARYYEDRITYFRPVHGSDLMQREMMYFVDLRGHPRILNIEELASDTSEKRRASYIVMSPKFRGPSPFLKLLRDCQKMLNIICIEYQHLNSQNSWVSELSFGTLLASGAN
jgi:hypothetical protein